MFNYIKIGGNFTEYVTHSIVNVSEIFARPIAIAIEGPTHNLYIMSITHYVM